ncbi:MAG: hypothetical protein K0R12_13 [Gammaproteobacteria bacterium]|jgi:hypothetical protein|nr:hypothetical protein [Gammaproteobacteria bacterium]
MLIFPDRPLPSSQLVRLVFSAFRATFLSLLPWLIPMAILAGFSYFYTAYTQIYLPNTPDTMPQLITTNHFYWLMELAYPILFLFLSFWFLLAMLCQGYAILSHKPLSRKEIHHFTQKHYWRFSAVSLINLAILSLLSPLILPYLFVFPIIVFAPMAVIFHHYRIFLSFKYTWQLVWGNWWHTFIVFLLAFFMPLVIIALLVLTLSYTMHAIAFIYLIAAIKLVTLFFILPLGINTLLILYNDLRLRYKAQPH